MTQSSSNVSSRDPESGGLACVRAYLCEGRGREWEKEKERGEEEWGLKRGKERASVRDGGGGGGWEEGRRERE